MLIPPNLTEAQVIEELDKVINNLVKDIKRFGYYDSSDDIKQQAYLFGIEAINTGKYDGVRPIGGFLRTCIINRFISLSRDKFCRNEPPCNRCPFFDKDKKKTQSGCMAFEDKMKCEKYKTYFNRNKVKRDLMNLKSEICVHGSSVSKDSKDLLDVDNKDLLNNIYEKLSPSSKETFTLLFSGGKVKKGRLDKLKKEIAENGN